MDANTIRSYADQVLGLRLDIGEAQELAQRLDGLRRLVEQLERVPLSYLEDPFTSPRSSDQWLEKWPTS